MALLTFPSELIEAILICSCSPRTVASVAQTCRTFHTLVYASPDSHLWRELFLTTWDDPRPALEHRALLDPRIDLTAWDWGTEYRRRVSADRWLKAWRRDIYLPEDDEALAVKDDDTKQNTAALSALSAVLDTLLTLQPFPTSPLIALTVLTPAISPYPTGNVGSGVGDRRERMTSAPPLPPLLIVLASGFSDFEHSQSGARVGRMVYGPYASRALVDNGPGEAGAEWVPIPTPSLPPQLVRTLLASHTVGVRGLPPYVPQLSGADCWGGDALGDVFHRIICITGFVPIPPPLRVVSVPTFTSTSTSGSDSDSTLSTSVDVNNGENEVEIQGGGKKHGEKDHRKSDEEPEAFPTPSQQHADARTLARRRVYDMRYLRGERLWGPFQPVTRATLNATRPGPTPLDADSRAKLQKVETRASTSGATSRRRGLRGLDTLAWAMGVEIELNDVDSTSGDDSGDEEWHDPSEAGPDASSSSQSRDREREQAAGGEDTAMTEDADRDPEIVHDPSLVSLILGSTDTVDTESTASPTSAAASRSSRRRTRRSNPRLPHNSSISPRSIKPEHLRPDYAYLASVRIVVEANLRELFGSEINDNVGGTASETRAGGVGMFWEDEDEIRLRAQAGSSEQGALSNFFLA